MHWFILAALAATAPSLVDRVVASRKCSGGVEPGQSNCRFTVDTVDFEIAGVGAKDAQIAVYAADINRTWVGIGMGHGCVMVKDQGLPIAFVSPKNARVYSDWVICQRADKSGR